MRHWAGLLLIISLFGHIRGQIDDEELDHQVRRDNDLMWCCLTEEELKKCRKLSRAMETDQEESDISFGSAYRKLRCKLYSTKYECMRKIDENDLTHPNIMNLDAGEVFIGGRYHSLVPILMETYENNEDFVSSVAVVKKNTLTHISHLNDFRGLKACFSEVSSLAGWIIPIFKLMETNAMPVLDCNNHVKTAIEFFGESCAVNSLQDRFNPLGDNSHKFCDLCGSDKPGIKCTSRDPYAGFSGAFRCLREKGDVAFVHRRVIIAETGTNYDDSYELLCPDLNGFITRRPIHEEDQCNWGVAPSNTLVVSSAMDMDERIAIQNLFVRALERYSGNRTFYDEENEINSNNNNDKKIDDGFYFTESVPYYGTIRNLMFNDDLKSFKKILPDHHSYKNYLGRTYGRSLRTPMEAVEGIRRCSVGSMTLCVTSDPEMAKCVRMRAALNAQLLEPKMSCKKARSTFACTQMIASNEADLALMEAGDIYRAGWNYGLIPIMAEVYNLGGPYYYAVAVVKQRDNR